MSDPEDPMEQTESDLPEGNGADPEAPEPEEPVAEAKEEPSVEDKLRAEKDRLKDQLLRTAADFDNFRKRTKKDIEEIARRSREDVIRDMLPVIDNLERAVDASSSASDVEAIIDGVRMVLRLFEDTAGRIGLARVKSVGERFDPNVHDAVQQQETDEHPPGTVVAEVVPGYVLGDRLLRAAMVVVARPPARPPEDKKEEPAAEPEKGGDGEAEASTDEETS